MGKSFDLAGQKFGKLIVKKLVGSDKNYNKIWECQCDCGNILVVQGGNLRNGATTNCGCSRIGSKGEELIAEFFRNNNIRYMREYTFNDLRNNNGNLLRFDFAIINNNNAVVMLIEYQGKQHYIDCGEFGLYQRKYSDRMKLDYCKIKNIPLYQIKYDDELKNSLPNLLNEIKYNLYANPVPSLNN